MEKSLETNNFNFRYFFSLTIDIFKENRKFLELYAFILIPALILSNFISQENLLLRDKIIFSAIYGVWFTIWQIAFTLKLEENIKGISHNFNIIKTTFKRLIPMIIADILFILIICLAFLFFVIPGFIIFMNFLFYKEALILRNKSSINAFSYSYNLIKGYRWKLFTYTCILFFASSLIELMLFLVFRNYQYDLFVVFLSSLILIFIWVFFVNVFIYLECLKNNPKPNEKCSPEAKNEVEST
jgi:hypothetical protein